MSKVAWMLCVALASGGVMGQAYGGGLAPVPGTTIDPAIRAGLDAWRTLDASGMACAHCHAPDAMDLAMFGVSEADIRRRASFHVSKPTATAIVGLVNAMRALHVAAPRDRFTDRPFQPGGYVLPGANHVERDAAFGSHLSTRLPTLTGNRITTTAQAIAARDELLAYDLRNEPLGIPFPRWSEDGFNGAEHGTMNDWLPDIAPLPPTPAAATTLFALHDAYIETPTPENLWAIQAHNDAVGVPGSFAGSPAPGTNAAVFGRRKHASMLLGQHLLRMEHASVPIAVPVGAPVAMRANFDDFNFPFDIASRINQSTMRPTRAEFASLLIGALTGGRGTNESTFRAMLHRELMVPWWMVGFVLEPGLQSIPNWHEYFPQSLVGHRESQQPYPMHHAFVTTMLAIHRTYTAVPTAAGMRKYPSLLTHWHTGANPLYTFAHRGLFVSPAHEALYRRTAANSTRMQLLVLKHEADDGVVMARPYAANATTYDLDLKIESWLSASSIVDPTAAQSDAATAWSAYASIAAWKRGGGPPPPDAGGSGLTVAVTVGTGVQAASSHGATRLEMTAPASGTTHAVFAGGMMTPYFTGPMRFDVDHGPNANTTGTRLWINGVLAFSEAPGTTTQNPWITLQGGQPVVFRLEYDRTRGTGGQTRVRWESSKEITRVVPAVQLFPLSQTPQYLYGDLNLDRVVDAVDIAKAASMIGLATPPLPDLTGDGVFTEADRQVVLSHLGPVP